MREQSLLVNFSHLKKSKTVLKIGTQSANMVIVADVMALLSVSKSSKQSAINKAENDASEKPYILSKTKTRSVTINPRRMKKME